MQTLNYTNTFFAFAIACVSALSASGQGLQEAFECRPNGSAVVVQDIEKSVQWYQSVFGLREKTRMDDPSGTYKVVILESTDIMFELLELKGSMVRSEVLKGKPEGTQIQGHFKIGFYVSDIDACLHHLKSLDIDVPNVWTDSSTGKRNFLINDPDGNYIQFFD